MAGLAVGVEGQDMGDQRLPQVGGGNEGDAIVDLGARAVLAGGGEEQVDEGAVARVGRAVGEGDGEGEGVAEQHIGTAGEGGAGARGQQAVVARGGHRGEGDGLVDIADLHLQVPIAAGLGAAGIVAGSGDIGAGPARQLVDQGAPGAAFAHLATVQLDVGAFAEGLAPLAQGLGELADVAGGDGGAAQGELPGSAVGEDLDGVHLAQLGERGGNRRQAILAALHHQRLDVTRQLREQLLAAFDAAVEHQQVTAGRLLLTRLAAGVVRGGVLAGGFAGVAAVLMLLVHRGSGGAIEEDAWFQRHRAALWLE
ncbi:hypothetical protein FQZ97_854370 [compost metagenome]